MKGLFLVLPGPEHEALWQEFIGEFLAAGERIIPGIARSGDGTYEDFLRKAESYRLGSNIPASHVPSTLWFLMDEKRDRVLGAIDIRHRLSDFLLKAGGHIGYGVAPAQRRKGYATKMLALALEECERLGIARALVTCDKTNVGSAKTIRKNGGVLENEVAGENGNIVQRYWIDVARRPRA